MLTGGSRCRGARGGDGDVLDGGGGDPHGVRVPPDLEPIGAVHHLVRRALDALARRRHRDRRGDGEQRGGAGDEDEQPAAPARHALLHSLARAAAADAGSGPAVWFWGDRVPAAGD